MTAATEAGAERISVIIPSTGRGTLAQTLAAMDEQSRQPAEVIVVEDERRRGSAWARNRGIEQAAGELVAFTDDDCRPPRLSRKPN